MALYDSIMTKERLYSTAYTITLDHIPRSTQYILMLYPAIQTYLYCILWYSTILHCMVPGTAARNRFKKHIRRSLDGSLNPEDQTTNMPQLIMGRGNMWLGMIKTYWSPATETHTYIYIYISSADNRIYTNMPLFERLPLQELDHFNANHPTNKLTSFKQFM